MEASTPRGTKNAKYTASRHSEMVLLQKLILPPEELVLVNVRIDAKGNAAMAQPCLNCARVVEPLFKKIFYTIDPETYGTI